MLGGINVSKKISILENFEIKKAKVIEKIVLPQMNVAKPKMIFRLTLALKTRHRLIEKTFYFIRESRLESDYAYDVLVDKRNVDNFILLNSLPKSIRGKLIDV